MRINIGWVETYGLDMKMVIHFFDFFYLGLMRVMRFTLSGMMTLLLTVKTGNFCCGTNIEIVYCMTAIVTWLRVGDTSAKTLAYFLATTVSTAS